MRRLLRIAEPVLLLATPLVLLLCALFQTQLSALLTFGVAVTALLVFFANFEARRPSLRQVMPTVVLAALAAAGRILFAPIPDFKPVSAICIMAGVVFGKRSGFMVGALAALVSNFFFGQGAWTPWQMYAWGIVGYLAGLAAERGLFDLGNEDGFPLGRTLLLGFGFLSGLLYGFILNSWYVVGFINPLTLPAALAAYAAGLPFDLVHAGATVVFLALLYLPWRRKLERIRTKYDLSEAN